LQARLQITIGFNKKPSRSLVSKIEGMIAMFKIGIGCHIL
jgi:hypothetical protein